MTERSEDNTARRRAMRQAMLARREKIDAATHAGLSARIVEHLQTALQAPKIAVFCWPIKNEPDVRALLEIWAASGTLAALPVVLEAAAPLAFRLWTPATPLIEDRYGIPTPASGDFVAPDLILLPLNAFDRQGYRLGYGGGFFDRTLATLSPRPLAVGIGFEINRVDNIWPEQHDQQLDWIVTENGAFRPAGV